MMRTIIELSLILELRLSFINSLLSFILLEIGDKILDSYSKSFSYKNL